MKVPQEILEEDEEVSREWLIVVRVRSYYEAQTLQQN